MTDCLPSSPDNEGSQTGFLHKTRSQVAQRRVKNQSEARAQSRVIPRSMKDVVQESAQTRDKTPLEIPSRKKSVLDRLFCVDSFESQCDDLNLLTVLPEVPQDEVRLHGTPDDCWIIINELVYDITEFLQKHPGGAEILWEHLGHDATLAFIGTGHSKAAHKMLDKFLVGRLVRDG